MLALPVRVAYLAGFYPAPSHTFITREVEGLRARGGEVLTLTLRPPPADTLLTEADHRAATETLVVQRPAPGALLRAHRRALAVAPLRYVRTLVAAVRHSAGGVRNAIWQLFYFVEAILVWDELERRGIRHLHAHFANASSAVAMWAARFGGPRGLRWSFTMHGPTEFDDVTAYDLAAKVRDASFVACIGEYCRSQLMRQVGAEHWARLAIVRCGIDVASIVPREAAPEAPGPMRVLCVGRLVPDKGQAVLLDAIADLRAAGHDVTLTLVGDGPDRRALTEAAERSGLGDAVTFCGALGHDEVLRRHREADVFCLPSFAEGVPVVLMEAMASGVPVVSTRVMGIPELVEDGRTGLLVAPGRPDALAAALTQLAADPARRAAMGRAGREKVAHDYETATEVARLERLFRQAAA